MSLFSKLEGCLVVLTVEPSLTGGDFESLK